MAGKFKSVDRAIREELAKTIEKGQSFFLVGPRQVGKTTLIADLLAGRSDVESIPLQDPAVRLAFEKEPGSIIRMSETRKAPKTFFIDEVQKVPELLDAAQLLIDQKKANFILTGSSARKLRKAGVNLLPGRVKSYRMDPLTWSELGWTKESICAELKVESPGTRNDYSFAESLVFGNLPGIIGLEQDSDKEEFLGTYAGMYLEEEIRAEALTRNVAAFSRFLELAAHESGSSPNLSKLAMETGMSVPTIKQYFSILDDTLVVERVEPYLKNMRKRILASPRYYFFDLGLRNSLASMPMETGSTPANKGQLFEHAVVLEIIRRIRVLRKRWKVCFWRTHAGAEVDCIVDMGEKVIPIEIKSGKSVRLSDLKGLTNFLADYPKAATQGYVITQGDYPEKISDNIIAVPWNRF